MFGVTYKDKFYKVYDVRDNGDYVPPDFLMCINCRWLWISSTLCMPIP